VLCKGCIEINGLVLAPQADSRSHSPKSVFTVFTVYKKEKGWGNGYVPVSFTTGRPVTTLVERVGGILKGLFHDS
jgi:hypothetical protein